jgi:hypothetical protein
MDLVKVELRSSSEACVTSVVGNEGTGVEGERVTDVKEEEDQETTRVPLIKTEPKVTGVLVVSTLHILVCFGEHTSYTGVLVVSTLHILVCLW